MPSLHPPLQLDIELSDFGHALAGTLAPRPRRADDLDEALLCLSVRTAFDLWLQVRGFAPGDEIAMSAVTLPDMATIARSHGLLVVPIDIDPRTMAPTAADVEAAIGPRTCAIVVAHLFGGRARLDAIADLAARRGVPLVEDCAQAFTGARPARHPMAALSLYSFGSIKTATALGGALALIADPHTRARMRAIASRYPRQSRRDYLGRTLKYLVLRALTAPRRYGAIAALGDRIGRDTAALAKKASRGFGSGDLLTSIRRRPSPALERMVLRRVSRASASHVAARTTWATWLVRMMPRWVEVPGSASIDPSWWLLPIAVGNTEKTCRALRAAGFDASPGTTSLQAIAAEPGRMPAARAEAIMQSIVYVPVSPSMSAEELRRIAVTIARVAVPRGATSARAIAA